MTDTNLEKQKIEVFDRFNAGESKASLALSYDVSSRTIGRWIDAVEESGYTKPKAVEAKSSEVEALHLEAYQEWVAGEYESKAELARAYGVSARTMGRWLDRVGNLDVTVTKPSTGHVAVKPEPVAKASKPAKATEYRHVSSSRAISITQIVDGKVTATFSIDKTHADFATILDSLLDANFSQEALADAYADMQPALAIAKFTQGKIQVDPQKREILYVADEDTVPYKVDNSLTQRIISMIQEGTSGVQTLLNFLEKLMENPSRRAVNELYGFLQANDIVIAEDGDFYAWKKVRGDFLDIHSGTMDNSVGKSPRVARNMVDEDSNRTCSYGLHVCSQSYLPSFGNTTSSRIVKVKVDPRDVVAVPADYNNAKMRTAGYTVIEEVTSTFYEGRKNANAGDDEEVDDDYDYS